MGLDMYLYAEKYIPSYDYEVIEGEFTRKRSAIYDSTINGAGMETLPTAEYGSATVAKCVGYWRKANAIHGWFVRELANGVDNCERIRVTRDDLKRLRDLCVNELSNRAMAKPIQEADYSMELSDSEGLDVVAKLMEAFKKETAKATDTQVIDDPLAPTAGFFFGSTEKDEWYYQALEYTTDTINSLLANDSDEQLTYYYEASW
jgi:hypothetical protein